MDRVKARLRAGMLAELRLAPGPVPRGVAGQLQRLIEDGTLVPGDRLPAQRELAETLGVSRPSLREALSVLQTLGFLVVRPGLGVFVQEPEARQPTWHFGDLASPADVYDARICLEAHAARRAAERAGEEDRARLAERLARMREASDRGDVAGMAAADAAFHDIVFEIADNPVLDVMVRSVRDLVLASQQLPMADRRTLPDTVREHEAILAAIGAADPAAAGAAMAAHIRAAARRYGIAP
jgi:GntR family transcriptional repressor for pyruvate dehydrogenase complex